MTCTQSYIESPSALIINKFDVAKAIGDMLAYNTSLRVLKMAGCLSSDGAKEVITGIGVNRALLKYACLLHTRADTPSHARSLRISDT
jgi:hypothetical protein